MLGIVRVFFIIFACSKPSASESEVGLNTKLGKFRKLGGSGVGVTKHFWRCGGKKIARDGMTKNFGGRRQKYFFYM